jgi:uncharacterized protein YeaO (DUF488 family)
MIRAKSVTTPARPDDGLRVLVTRFRGRRLSRSSYDVWMPSLGPSEELLRDFQSGRLTFAAFRRAYRDELFMPGAIDARNRTIRNHGQRHTLRLLALLGRRGDLTVLCHCAEDEPHCHRHELVRLLRQA